MQAEDDPTPLKPTRASFVRGLPESMPLEEVIERGREAGISLNPSDVHSVRYYMRQEALAKLSSRPIAVVPQLVHASPVTRAKPEPAKPDAKPTHILGLHAATSGKERPVVKPRPEIKGRRAEAAPVAASAKPQRGKLPHVKLPPVKLSGPLEEQLRQIVMRIGTERARRIIEQMENLKV
jgi:hypothetical protein